MMGCIVVFLGIVAELAPVAVGAEADRPCYGVLVVEAVGADGYVSADMDLASIQEALDLAYLSTRVEPPKAFLESPQGLTPLAIQWDGIGAEVRHITFVLPQGTALPARVRVYFLGNAPEGDAAPVETALSAREEDGKIIVNNGFVEVVHDPAVQAGLPAQVKFLVSGKTLDGYVFNDRVYEKDRGGFFLRLDPKAKVRLVRNGAIEVVVETSARYVQGETAPSSKPRATYRFHYRAGSPAIEVTAHCEQDDLLSWHELHLIEWNFPERPLRDWATGAPKASGAFEEDKVTMSGSQWACLSDGQHVVGVAGGGPKLYSGDGYGSYVHGPWISWHGKERDLSCTVWLDAQPETIDRLAAHSSGASQVNVTTPVLEETRREVAARIDALEKGHLRGAHAWWLSATDRLATQPDTLGAALAELRLQHEWLRREPAAAADEVIARVAESSGNLVKDTGEILLVMGGPADGYPLAGLFSTSSERELLAGGSLPLWTLAVEDAAGTAFDWGAASDVFTAQCRDEGAKIILTWQGHDAAAGLGVEVEMEVAGASASFTCTVKNESNALTVMRLRFPQVAMGPIGPDAGDDAFVTPKVSGTLVKAPLVNGLSSDTIYPSGWGSMQLVAHYDADAGLYLAAHDPAASLKRLDARCGAGSDRIDAFIEWPAPDASRMGNDIEPSGRVVLTAFTGDWFDVAQLYRRWAEAEAAWWPYRGEWGRPDTADWVKDLCVWALDNGFAKDMVPRVKHFAEFMGVPTAVHWYSWHEIPFDDDYPHYFPVKDGFADGVAELQEAGVRVMPYINGRLWDSDTDDFESAALPGATKQRNGEYYVEVYGSGQNLVPMCPTQQVWQDKVEEIVLRLMSPECNVDGVYIDQVAAAQPRECFDAGHGHPLCGGHWWTTDGYWPMLTKLNAMIDERYPEKFLTTECNAEPYTHVFDGYLTWHFQYNDAIPLFAAIYAGKIMTFSRAFNGNDQQAHRMKIGQAFAWGEQLGWISPAIVDEQPVTAGFLRRCARIRYKLLPYLARGYMARPPQVVGDIPDVTADWAWSGAWPVTTSVLQRGAWRAEDGSTAFVFANVTEDARAFTWNLDPGRYDLPAGELKQKMFSEDAETDWLPVEAPFAQPIALGPLEVKAFVIR